MDIFTEAAILVHYQNVLVLLALFLAGVILFERKKAYAQAGIMALIISLAMQTYFNAARPCAELASLVPCPTEAGFPSVHAALAAVFLMGSVGSKWFFVAAPLALVIAYSRIYLGVHTPGQILAGMALGITVYLLNWLHMREKK
ncbi:phosphatase PAP2 family protein [Candidatus Micrarchaeota archaeon]|nr:phosphatase PAP2 family protein [Candidatus Micrarchaeota archaeon]